MRIKGGLGGTVASFDFVTVIKLYIFRSEFKWVSTESLSIGRRDMQGKNILSARDPEPFDWYQRFSGLRDIITTNIDK